ncbi:hypothetical protein [Acinetobacter baumannii]|uniref:hypothetical protein n=1 Tax=Acinetobacter baumannii TaxID=470 RepID=UPI001CB7CEAC|nr:hypothetical protein [Acinetobacter baumannii]
MPNFIFNPETFVTPGHGSDPGEKITAEVRKLQPAYKMIKGSRTVIRIEVETAKRIRETAVQKKGETLSSFTNAAVYYFLKNGDFETLPELKQSIDEIENIEL